MLGFNVKGNLTHCLLLPADSVPCVVHLTTIPADPKIQIQRADGTVVGEVVPQTLVNTIIATVPVSVGLRAVLYSGVNIVDSSLYVTATRLTGNEFSPRFGVHDKVLSRTGFDAAFMASLTTILTEAPEQFITCPKDTSTSDNNRFFYVAWPKRLVYGYFRDFTSGQYGFAGSWDGAEEFGDFTFVGPSEVTINGVDYVIYRNDFPFDSVNYVYSILYGSTTPKSGDV